MTIFSYHLLELPNGKALAGLFSSPVNSKTKGLVHAEYMTAMTLGSPIFSKSRFLFGQTAVVMQWENEYDLESIWNEIILERP